MFSSMMYTTPGTQRWTARRKLEVIEALQAGQITREAIQQLGISDEELAEWERRYNGGDRMLARSRLQATNMRQRWNGATRKQRRIAAAHGEPLPR